MTENNSTMDKQWFLFSYLFRLISYTQTCSAPNGGFSRTGLNLELCGAFTIWLPRSTCSGQASRWAEPMRKCSAIGSVFYRVSRLLDSSWSTALQERVAVSWNGREQALTAPTHSAGSTQGAECTQLYTVDDLKEARFIIWHLPLVEMRGPVLYNVTLSSYNYLSALKFKNLSLNCYSCYWKYKLQ